jgi:hypothetical protein
LSIQIILIKLVGILLSKIPLTKSPTGFFLVEDSKKYVLDENGFLKGNKGK